MQENNIIALSAGPLELVLAPRVGGCIAGFFRDGVAILRGMAREPASVLDAGSFPLVPYVNRVRGGRFSFRGREVSLAPNMTGDPSPLHGQGWLSAWNVVRADEGVAELAFLHEAGEWPWRYEARQYFALSDTALELRLACRNLGGAPMPCGLGQHPYFPCGAGTRIETRVSHAWTIDDMVLPVERVAATGRFDLSDRTVCGQDLDHGFEGWGGTARISAAALPFAIEMSSPDARFFQLYSPPSGDLFVAEPVTHRNAALNEPEADWAEAGMRVLEPGEEMSLTMRIALT